MEPMTSYGTFSSYCNSYVINLSEMFSHLVRECGRLVDDYNSDIIVVCNSIEKLATLEREDGTHVVWIGLRQNGVDGELFMCNRCDNPYYYRGIYKVTVVKTESDCNVRMEKKDYLDFRSEHPSAFNGGSGIS